MSMHDVTCGDEFSSVEIEGNPPEPFRCELPTNHAGMHVAQISWGSDG